MASPQFIGQVPLDTVFVKSFNLPSTPATCNVNHPKHTTGFVPQQCVDVFSTVTGSWKGMPADPETSELGVVLQVVEVNLCQPKGMVTLFKRQKSVRGAAD
jgi:hypothetical protein